MSGLPPSPPMDPELNCSHLVYNNLRAKLNKWFNVWGIQTSPGWSPVEDRARSGIRHMDIRTKHTPLRMFYGEIVRF